MAAGDDRNVVRGGTTRHVVEKGSENEGVTKFATNISQASKACERLANTCKEDGKI